MLDLFKVHTENTIGIKKLTNADLGIGKSHQTHIGLYNDVLTFIDDHTSSENGLFFSNGSYEIVDIYFDRITNPDGTTRSPKFRLGTSEFSLVNRIRSIIQEVPEIKWYLIWLGTDSGKIITALFSDEDSLFSKLNELEGESLLDSLKVISPKNQHYDEIILQIQNYIISILKQDIEIIIKKIQQQQMLGSIERTLDSIFNLTDFTSLLQQKAIEHLSVFLDRKKQAGQITDFEILRIGANKYANFCKMIINNKVERNVLLKISLFEEPQEFFLTSDELTMIQKSGDFGIFSFSNIDEKSCELRVCSSMKVVMSHLSNYQVDYNLLYSAIANSISMENLVLKVKTSILIFGDIKNLSSPI
nr:hypothetical protein [uncultured Sphaerochaeta sp.]